MEETPPPPRKPRRPRTESSAQEPAPRTGRRVGGSAPPVTVQPPTVDEPGAETPRPRKSPAKSGPRKPPPAKATPPDATGPEATPPEATPPEATPPEATPPEATPPEATPPEATGAEATGAEAVPAKQSPAPSAAEQSIVAETASEQAAPETVPDKSAAGDPASIVDVTPAQDPPARTPPDAATAPPSTEPVVTVERTVVPAGAAHVSGGLWAQLRDEPGQAREVLARVAVEVLGPRAKVWAAQTREAYPQVGAADVARLAVQRAGRNGLVGGALAALSGAFAPVTSMVAAAWTQAALVLEVAAAYGVDPADEGRVVEVLEITGTRNLGMPVVAQVTGWFALRTVNRILPGSALLAATLGGRAAAERVGARAVAFYSQESQAFGNRV